MVLLDATSWQAFLDLAGALRRSGVRVDRVTARPRSWQGRVRQIVERPLFVRVHRFEAVWSGHDAVPVRATDLAALCPRGTTEVVAQEGVLGACLGIQEGPVAPARHVAPGVDPAVLVDKWLQADLAHQAGVATPTMWDSPPAVSLPAVVKPRRGFGGHGVQVVRDREELARAWCALEDAGETPYAQSFHEGAVNTGGVALRGDMLVCATFRPAPAPDLPTGPPRWITTEDNPAALDATRALLAATGLSGFFSFNWVYDDPAVPLLIDLNPRPFGSWSLLQTLGVDLVEAYLHVIGAGPRPAPSSVPPGATAEQVVYPCPTGLDAHGIRRWYGDSMVLVRDRREILGRRWSSVMRARLMLSALQRMLQRGGG